MITNLNNDFRIPCSYSGAICRGIN